MRWIGKSYHALSDKSNAMAWYYKSIGECPNWRDTYVEAAQAAYEDRDWDSVYYFAQKALSIPNKNPSFVNEFYSWNYVPEDLAALACWNLGLKEKAIIHAKNALELSPENQRLQENLEIMTERSD